MNGVCAVGAPPPVELLCLIGGHVQGHALWARGQRRLRAGPLHRVDQVNATLALPVVAGLLERNTSLLDLAKTRHPSGALWGRGALLGEPGREAPRSRSNHSSAASRRSKTDPRRGALRKGNNEGEKNRTNGSNNKVEKVGCTEG